MAKLIYSAITSLDGYVAAAGRDITVGGPGLAAAAIKAGLVDEYHLFVTPVVGGGGKLRLPHDVRLELELLDERRFANGVVHLHYRTVSPFRRLPEQPRGSRRAGRGRPPTEGNGSEQ